MDCSATKSAYSSENTTQETTCSMVSASSFSSCVVYVVV